MTFDMLGMSLMALMVLLVIGGGTTWAHLVGNRGARHRAAAPTQEQAPGHSIRPSAGHRLEESPTSGRLDHHGRRYEFLGP
jgi:hypothetical protein